MKGHALRIPVLSAAFCLSACASVDYDAPKVESHASTETTNTLLGREVAALGSIP